MNPFCLQSLLAIPRLTPGRRAIALERIRTDLAEIPAAAVLLPAIDRALAAHRRALALEAEWRGVSGSQGVHAPGARALDAQLDKALGAFHGTLGGIAITFGPREAALARQLRAAVFPRGVGAVTSLPY